jgi:hypothetical protein
MLRLACTGALMGVAVGLIIASFSDPIPSIVLYGKNFTSAAWGAGIIAFFAATGFGVGLLAGWLDDRTNAERANSDNAGALRPRRHKRK